MFEEHSVCFCFTCQYASSHVTMHFGRSNDDEKKKHVNRKIHM